MTVGDRSIATAVWRRISISQSPFACSAAIAYIQATPADPVKTRAPQAQACLTTSNCECSPSATMYSQSISPFATSLATYCITVSYGRIGYAVITSTSANWQAMAIASLPVMSDVFSAGVACATGVEIASAIGDLLLDLLFVLPAVTEAVRSLGPVLDGRQQPALVGRRVLAEGLPLAGVVGERGLVHHRDALLDRADGLADAAAAAG